VTLQQEKQQLEAELADAKRSVTKLKQRIAEMRDKNASMEKRMMMLLGQASMSPRMPSSAGGDCSGHSSADDAPADRQQVGYCNVSRHGYGEDWDEG